MTDRLALYGGEMSVKGQIARYNPIGEQEVKYVAACVEKMPLSGYLGGRKRGGAYVQRLEELWAAKFGVRHAIAVNSATSGLLAAGHAADLYGGTHFITTPFSMSATAAAPAAFGATPVFVDIDYDDYCLDPQKVEFEMITKTPFDPVWKAIVVTNLFGNVARLKELRQIADRRGVILIEDNAQSILAKEEGKYAGTIGHIGVFSLNVHKHIQCGEGGVIVTNDDVLADKMRDFINHGELCGRSFGMNLRLAEPLAAIAISQLERVEELVTDRVLQANRLMTELSDFRIWAAPPKVREGVEHVYYTVPFIYRRANDNWPTRDLLLRALSAEGVPLVPGYVEPLHRLPAFALAENRESREHSLRFDRELLFYFSNCEWSPNPQQMSEFALAFQKVWDNIRSGRLRGDRDEGAIAAR